MLIRNTIPIFRKRAKRRNAIAADPRPVQEQQFNLLLEKYRQTQFGKDHDLKSIRTYDDFRKAMPLRNYDGFKPYIDKMLEGQRNILWPGLVKHFCFTSGTTTGRNKYIPLSKEGKRSQAKAGRDLVAFYISETQNTKILHKRIIYVASSPSFEINEHGMQIGELSGLMTREFPWLLRRFVLAVTNKIARITDWETKIDAIVARTANMDVASLSGLPSWSVVILERVARMHGMDPTKPAVVKDFWPNFSLLVHSGVSFAPYRDLVRRYVGPNVTTKESYAASEAFVGVQDRLDEPGLLLNLDHGYFFEFIPLEELESDNPTRIPVWEVEIGPEYAIVMTTNSGFCSYLIGDTVRFVTTFPHRVSVSGRISQFLSAFGEHLIVEQVENAMATACEETGAEVNDFTGGPSPISGAEVKMYHEYIVEFHREPITTDVQGFIRIFDAKLKSANEDYEVHRHAGDAGIQYLKFNIVEQGTFYKWLVNKRGQVSGQTKVPRLSNDRKFLDPIIDFVGERRKVYTS